MSTEHQDSNGVDAVPLHEHVDAAPKADVPAAPRFIPDEHLTDTVSGAAAKGEALLQAQQVYYPIRCLILSST
jgi:hypothetical protein